MHVLYLDVDTKLATEVKKQLEQLGYQVEIAAEDKLSLEKIADKVFDMAIFDFKSLSDEGISCLRRLSQQQVYFPAVLSFISEDLDQAASIFELGCQDYVIKDVGNYVALLSLSISKILQDIKLREAMVKAELELQTSLKTSERVQAISKVGNWEYYPGKKIAKWSPQEFRNFGYQPDSVAPTYDKYFQVIHPEDREAVERLNLACIDEQNHKPAELIFRLLLENEEIRYIRGITEVDVDQNGEVNRVFGVSQDITEQIESEAELKQAIAVFNTTAEAIFITDAEKTILSINPAFSQITGYEKQSVVNQPSSVLSANYHSSQFFEDFWTELKLQGKWQGELWIRHQDGHIFPTWQSVAVIKDAEGHIVQYVSIFSDISERKESEELILYQANYDGLTALPNRHLFLDRMNNAIHQAERNKSKIALFLLDLDRFKWINDTLGHRAGDFVLQETAKRLKQAVRTSDTVARLGGDEFTVILPVLEGSHSAGYIAEKIFKAFELPVDIDGNEVFISGSIGISIYPEDGRDTETLQKNADSAMYSAKEAGRNRYHYFTEDLHQEAERRLKLINYLRRALERDEFSVFYQPVIDIVDNEIIGAEALIRWKHPELGYIPPVDFIPLAEETGLIREIGNWVVRRVAKDIKRWQNLNLKSLQISINKSPKQFVHAGKDNDWNAVFAEFNVPLANITVEITESVFMEKGLYCADELANMQKSGIKVSLDDFGTGYSSLSYLKRFPVDILKIDREFINDIVTDPSDALLVETIITLADKMNFKVIAEGVETKEQLNFLKKNNCRFVQGFYISKPLPRDEFERFLEDYLFKGTDNLKPE